MKNLLLPFLFFTLSGNVLFAQVDSLRNKILQVADLQADFNFKKYPQTADY
jgi:hypothetical protein